MERQLSTGTVRCHCIKISLVARYRSHHSRATHFLSLNPFDHHINWVLEKTLFNSNSFGQSSQLFLSDSSMIIYISTPSGWLNYFSISQWNPKFQSNDNHFFPHKTWLIIYPWELVKESIHTFSISIRVL